MGCQWGVGRREENCFPEGSGLSLFILHFCLFGYGSTWRTGRDFGASDVGRTLDPCFFPIFYDHWVCTQTFSMGFFFFFFFQVFSPFLSEMRCGVFCLRLIAKNDKNSFFFCFYAAFTHFTPPKSLFPTFFFLPLVFSFAALRSNRFWFCLVVLAPF